MKLTEYDLVAESLERVLAVRRPTIDGFGGLNARIVVPPVTVLGDLTIDGVDELWAPSEIPPDLLDHVNVAFVVLRDDIQPGFMIFNWVRTATKEQRRRARFHSKHMVAVTHAGISGGRWLEFETRLCSFINGRWIDAIGNVIGGVDRGWISGRNVVNPAEDDERIRMSISLGLNLRYCYSATLSSDPGCLTARIYAYPDTVRFLLRTRNVGNDQRRKALVHLVRRHARRRKKSFGVAAHLRGEYRCTWAGLDVAVLPSQYDAETTHRGAVLTRLDEANLLRWVTK